MKISISAIDKVMVVDNIAVQFDDFALSGVPPCISAIQMDSENGGHIEWYGKYPVLHITYDQFKQTFHVCLGHYEMAKNKIHEEQMEAKREAAKLEAIAVVEAQKKETELANLFKRVDKLEKRENLE